MNNQDPLMNIILTNSVSPIWLDATLEWEITSVIEDPHYSLKCVCGRESLRYLFTIKNTKNNSILYPIGIDCLKKFCRNDMYEQATLDIQLYKLLHAVKDNEYIKLKSNLFSRRLLKYLYDQGAFKPNPYNNQIPYNDYKFMLKIFNKKEPNKQQLSRATAITMNQIVPYLTSIMKNKIIGER